MASVAPIIIPQDYMMIGNERKTDWTIRGQNGIFLVALLEIVSSVVIMSLYSYALGMKPDWYPVLIPLPSDLCTSDANIVGGLMYVIVLLGGMELLLGLYLLEGARQEKLGIIRFWMSSMFMYIVIITMLIVGMGLGGMRSPKVNFTIFLTAFIRFLEILMVYEWSEQMKVLRRQANNGRTRSGGTRSSYTIFTVGSDEDDELGVDTPPPSYSSTIRSTSYRCYQQPQMVEEQQPLLYPITEEQNRYP